MPWEPLGAVPPRELVPARLVLHWAAQLVAAAGEALLPHRPDDSQSALSFAIGAFLGEPIGGGVVALRAAELQLLVADQKLDLPGKTRDDALAWLGAALGQEKPLPPYPHLPPAHPVGGGAPFPAPGVGEAELGRWFGNAVFILERLAARRRDAGPITLWPHHFDVATLLDLGEGRTIGVGLSPGDTSYDEPYFYVTPSPPPSELPALPLGRWHDQGWLGAVLTGSETRGADVAETFVTTAVAACEERISKK